MRKLAADFNLYWRANQRRINCTFQLRIQTNPHKKNWNRLSSSHKNFLEFFGIWPESFSNLLEFYLNPFKAFIESHRNLCVCFLESQGRSDTFRTESNPVFLKVILFSESESNHKCLHSSFNRHMAYTF